MFYERRNNEVFTGAKTINTGFWRISYGDASEGSSHVVGHGGQHAILKKCF